MIFQKISCENAPKCRIKVLTTKCKKDCILQEPYAKIPQNHSFFFKTLETNIRSCYTIQTNCLQTFIIFYIETRIFTYE